MRVEKIQLASFISTLIKESDFSFFISYKGLSVSEFSEFRNKLYSVEAKCHVLKNSLICLGLDRNEIVVPPDIEISGGTAAVFGQGDPCPVAKTIKNFSSDFDAITFKAGLLGGSVLNASDAARIAELPSKEVLQSQFLSVLQAPMTNMVRVFNAKMTSLVYLIQAYIDKKENSS